MRHLLSILLLFLLPFTAVLLILQAQENEAEKLFRAMEQKITQAKAIQILVGIEGTTVTKDLAGKGDGSILLTKGNQLRIKATKTVEGVTHRYEMISDGSQIRLKPYPTVPIRKTSLATPKYLHRDLTTMVTRLGVETTLNAMPFVLPVAEFDEEKSNMKLLAAATKFQEHAAEKIGGRAARVISFQVGAQAGLLDEKEDKVLARVTLWIDSATLLPRKRAVRLQNGVTITEIYNEFRLDPTIDAKDFDVPN